jgi:hypothetical protein
VQALLGHLQELAGIVRATQLGIAETVQEARSAGASWDAIGWSVGTTGEAARQRWAA